MQVQRLRYQLAESESSQQVELSELRTQVEDLQAQHKVSRLLLVHLKYWLQGKVCVAPLELFCLLSNLTIYGQLLVEPYMGPVSQGSSPALCHADSVFAEVQGCLTFCLPAFGY